MAQKPRCAEKSKNCRKSMSLPLAACAASDNLPDAYATELFKPSKDSSLVVCTEKKKLEIWAWVLGGCRQDWGMFYYFLIFFDDVIARTMSRHCNSNFSCILGCDMNL